MFYFLWLDICLVVFVFVFRNYFVNKETFEAFLEVSQLICLRIMLHLVGRLNQKGMVPSDGAELH